MYNLKLDKWQKEFLETKGDKILCSGRQVGKSVVCAIDAGEWAIKNGDKTVLMIAPTERQAQQLFQKTLIYLEEKCPDKIKRGKDRPTKSKLQLKNETEIICLPTGKTGAGIRTYTIDRLYIEEASRVPEDVWAAVTPMITTTGGDQVVLSTPFGATGEFFRIFKNKDNAYSSFTRFSKSTEDVVENRPISDTWTEKQRDRALQHLEREKKRMSKREYAQEYVGEFIEELHRYFSDEVIEKCCNKERPEDISKGSEYYLGVDLARMGEDEITFEIIKKINKDNLIQVESIVDRKKRTTETEKRIKELNKQYDFNKIYIDAGAGTLGVSIFDHLLDDDETGRKVEAINNRARPMNRDGTKKKKLLKEDLYSNLLALMEQDRIKLLKDEDIKESLRSVQYEYVQKEGKRTHIRIFGNYTHITEGLIRAAWCVKEKDLNIWVSSIKV